MFIALAAVATAWAQTPAAFEVASIKVSTAGNFNMGSNMRAGQMQFTNYPLRAMVQLAYRVKDYAYVAPAYLDALRFDVIAKLPAGAPATDIPKMVQTLLAERFKLVTHWEEKEMPGLALTVDKKGLRIKPVEPGQRSSAWGANMVQGKGLPMGDFADMLSTALGRPVQNLTELAGVYDFKIKWLPDGPLPADTSDMAASVYAAVQDQLGLKLTVQKVPVKILVVDHAEKLPVEN